MKKSYLLFIIGLLTLIILGMIYFQSKSIFKTEEQVSSDVLLEEVAKVFKLVAVEGHVSEIYDYKQYRYWDVSFLRKQALIRVKAKVSVGYDFEEFEFVVDETNRKVILKDFPDPEILAVDHDLDYYNIQEGVFNSFSASEMSGLNKKAKEHIVNVIKQGDLFAEAELQKESLMDLLESIFSKTGWQLELSKEVDVLLN